MVAIAALKLCTSWRVSHWQFRLPRRFDRRSLLCTFISSSTKSSSLKKNQFPELKSSSPWRDRPSKPSEKLLRKSPQLETVFGEKRISHRRENSYKSDNALSIKPSKEKQSTPKVKIRPQRLSKALAASGVASRRSCEELVFNGRVTLNGSICVLPQTKVEIGKDVIYVNGELISKERPPKLYLALNKPKGYICSAGEEEYRTVISLFDEYLSASSGKSGRGGTPPPRLFTAGTLDVSATGLLIVTNDGGFAQKLSHPSSGILKEYIATIDGKVCRRHVASVRGGATLHGVHCRPSHVEMLAKQDGIVRPRLRIAINEGRNHEVRDIVESSGLKVTSLRRVRIGSYRLPMDLRAGEFLPLQSEDLSLLLQKTD